ncbi:MAG: ABC transporter permease [Deinococcus sp.]
MPDWSPTRKGRVLLANGFAVMTAYRAQIFIWMLSGTLSLVMMLVWIGQAGQTPGGRIGGDSGPDFAAYFLSVWLAGQLMVVWVSWELDFQIRQGTLSPKLLRPLDPMWLHLSEHLAERLVRVPLMLVMLAAFALLTHARFSAGPLELLLFVALVLLGFAFRFLWEYSTGLLAFWTDSSTSFSDLNWLLYSALGGLFAPLSFYPAWVQGVARLTPFPYMLGLPAELLSGRSSVGEAGRGLLILAAWTLAFWLVRLAMWRLGLRKYGAVGA